MGDLLNYESDNLYIVELLEQGIHFSHHLLSNFNIKQGELFPVIAQSAHPNIGMIKWGIENPILAEGPALTYIFGPSIEKQERLKKLFRHQRVLIPANKFIHRRAIDEPNVIIKHPQNRMLWMGGIWYEGKSGEKGFALITQNSIKEQRNEIRRIPVFINQNAMIRPWLDTNYTNLMDLNKLLNSKTETFASLELTDMVQV